MLSNAAERERAFTMARISADKHGAKNAVVVGHSQCAGHPVSNEDHHRDIEKSVNLVKDTGIFEHVIGLFVDVDTNEILEVCRV
jgi:hypothetical protein